MSTTSKDWLDGYEAGVQAAQVSPPREQQRFTAAVAAMRAFINEGIGGTYEDAVAMRETTAKAAVLYADALLAALDGGAK